MIEFKDVVVTGDPGEEPRGKALVVFAHGEGMVLAWQATRDLRGFFLDCGAKDEPFSLDESFDFEAQPDGVHVAELRFVDDGPGEAPGTREHLPGLHAFRPATAEEWTRNLSGEWPWEPIP